MNQVSQISANMKAEVQQAVADSLEGVFGDMRLLEDQVKVVSC